MTDDDETQDPERPETRGTLALLRRPDIPVTVDQLAARQAEGIAIIEARARILETARVMAIRMTSGPDWVLYRAPDGQVTGYLQDAGAQRVRGIFGISVYNLGPMERVNGSEPGEFFYLIRADGRANLTGEIVEAVEGARSSLDDNVKDKKGVELERAVRKNARANLNGSITRELAGLKSVPAEEITRAWAGTAKTLDTAHLGRGFGSREERLGASSEKVPDVPPPICPFHKTPGVYRPAKGNRGAFYGCPKYGEHPKDAKAWIVDAAKWVAQQDTGRAERSHQSAPAAAGAESTAALTDRPCAVCQKPKADHANADHEYETK